MNRMTPAQSLALDAIRAFAAQIVVIGHALSFFEIRKMPFIQKSGVVIFFILSGLVITYSVLQKDRGSYGFKEFFIARFARIYSGLFPCLLFILCLDYAQLYFFSSFKYSAMLDAKTFLGNLLMLQNYQDVFGLADLIPSQYFIEPLGSGRPLWTLGIEWWIYMAFGFMFCIRDKTPVTYALGLVLIALPLWNLVAGGGNGLTFYWLEGAAITYLIFYRKSQMSFSKKQLLLSCLGLLLLAALRLKYAKTPYDPIFATFCALMILSVIFYLKEHGIQHVLLSKTITLSAAYSYTLYLTHHSIMSFLSHYNHSINKYYLFVLAIIVSNIVALALAYHTEMKHKQFAMFLRRFCGMSVSYAK